MRDGAGASEDPHFHPDFASSEFSDEQLKLFRLEAAVKQFLLNLGEEYGWNGEASYDSPEIWTMRGYLESSTGTNADDLEERFGRAWAIVEQTVANEVEDPHVAQATEVLLKSHLFNQVAVTLVTTAIRTEVDRTKGYIGDAIIQPFCNAVSERSQQIASLRSGAAYSHEETEKEISSLVSQQQSEAEATVQVMLRTLVSLRNALPLLVDGGIIEHKVSYVTELAIADGFYEDLQRGLETVFAEPLGIVVRQTSDEMLKRMQRVLKEGGFLGKEENFSPDLGVLEPRWEDIVPPESIS